MYPPPHVTCMYPPPHVTCMYPPPHVTCMYLPPHVTCMYPPPHVKCMYPPPHATCMYPERETELGCRYLIFVLLQFVFVLFSFFVYAGLDAKQQQELVKMRTDLFAGACVACVVECFCVSGVWCLVYERVLVCVVRVCGVSFVRESEWCMCVRVRTVYVCAREGRRQRARE